MILKPWLGYQDKVCGERFLGPRINSPRGTGGSDSKEGKRSLRCCTTGGILAARLAVALTMAITAVYAVNAISFRDAASPRASHVFDADSIRTSAAVGTTTVPPTTTPTAGTGATSATIEGGEGISSWGAARGKMRGEAREEDKTRRGLASQLYNDSTNTVGVQNGREIARRGEACDSDSDGDNNHVRDGDGPSTMLAPLLFQNFPLINQVTQKEEEEEGEGDFEDNEALMRAEAGAGVIATGSSWPRMQSSDRGTREAEENRKAVLDRRSLGIHLRSAGSSSVRCFIDREDRQRCHANIFFFGVSKSGKVFSWLPPYVPDICVCFFIAARSLLYQI